MPLIEYLIHRRRLDGDLTTNTTRQSDAAQHPSFVLNEGSEVQMVSVPNELVKSTRYMTRSTTDELFSTLGLDGKGLEQHLKVV